MPPPTDIAVPLHGLGVALEWEAADTSTPSVARPPCQLQPSGPLYSCAAVNEVCGAGCALRWPALERLGTPRNALERALSTVEWEYQ